MIKALLAGLLASLYLSGASALYHRDVTAKTFDKLIDPSKAHIMLEFYAPWCGHCKSLAPEYEKLGNTFADWKDIVIAQVDADKHKSLAKRFNVQGFPTLKWLKMGSTFDDIADVDAGRTAEDLLKFVNDKTGLSVKLKGEPESAVVPVKESNFDELVAKSGNHAFLLFFAPWCGHCKAIKPAWNDLARLYADEDSVVVGSVNCDEERELCDKYEVKGFPTLNYFAPGGAAPETYDGTRDLEGLAQFLSPKAGLDLAHDGGVLPAAGVIQELDEHLETYMKAQNPEERSNVVNVCKERVGELDKSAGQKFGYYLKVFNKIAEKGVDYLETEKKRLDKIMESADDMEGAQRRSFLRRINVLGAFLGGK